MAMRRFLNDKSGSSFEGIALSVSIIAVAFVASADMLDYMTKPHSKIEVAAARPSPVLAKSDAGKADLDMTPTASLPHLISRSILDPCTGEMH